MKCRPRFIPLEAVGSSYNLGLKCTETYRDHFEPRLVMIPLPLRPEKQLSVLGK